MVSSTIPRSAGGSSPSSYAASTSAAAEAVAAEVLAAYELGDEPPAVRGIVLDTIG